MSDPTVSEVVDLIQEAGGTVEHVFAMPDGSGGLTASFPLPVDHWLYAPAKDGFEAPPMTFRRGTDDPERRTWDEKIRAAARYAVRASTNRGQAMDFDPDALVQNMVVGMLGYWTPDGLTDDEWANPNPIPEPMA